MASKRLWHGTSGFCVQDERGYLDARGSLILAGACVRTAMDGARGTIRLAHAIGITMVSVAGDRITTPVKEKGSSSLSRSN